MSILNLMSVMSFWSPFIFWFVAINVFVTLVFTVVVIIGGISDLKFLFKSLREADVDETDDGRVEVPPAQNA